MKHWAAMLALMGCGTTELSQSFNLDRIRLLGVRAAVAEEPDPILGGRAEPRPGETVAFTALTYFPDGQDFGGALWFACLPEGELAYGCEVDDEALTAFEDLDESASAEDYLAAVQAAQAAGVIGFQPLFDPTWTVPDDALASLTEAERTEGTNAFINVTLFGTEGDTGETDDENAEIGFKRMPISEAGTPNHNPDIVDFAVDGERLNGAEGFSAARGQTYTLDPVLPDGHIETYSFVNRDGESVYRAEEPYFQWYTEPGSDHSKRAASFDQPLSLAPYSSVEWTAPTQGGSVSALRSPQAPQRPGFGPETEAHLPTPQMRMRPSETVFHPCILGHTPPWAEGRETPHREGAAVVRRRGRRGQRRPPEWPAPTNRSRAHERAESRRSTHQKATKSPLDTKECAPRHSRFSQPHHRLARRRSRCPRRLHSAPSKPPTSPNLPSGPPFKPTASHDFMPDESRTRVPPRGVLQSAAVGSYKLRAREARQTDAHLGEH